ncbi:hypothetical protein WEI85_14675 [Actinomycetes bacterium KLBMP 9797]
MRPPRVLDSSALIDLFGGHPALLTMLTQAENGELQLMLPTAALADAEDRLQAGSGGWEPLLLTSGFTALPLTEHAAIEVGQLPGKLATRHAVHEAVALRATIVTRKPGAYKGQRVSLMVV